MAHEDDQFLSPAVGRSNQEQRVSPRFTLLIRAAKLIVDGDSEFLCVIRDASSTGLKIRLFHPLPTHYRTLSIEMSNGDRYSAEVVWMEGDFAGFRFLDSVDIDRLRDEAHGAYPKRHVRLRVRLDAMLHSGGEAVQIAFQDISQQGACVDCDKWLLMNELVRVETGVLPAIYAKVRWRSHPRYGLLFEQVFKLDELARFAAPLQPGDIWDGEHEQRAAHGRLECP